MGFGMPGSPGMCGMPGMPPPKIGCNPQGKIVALTGNFSILARIPSRFKRMSELSTFETGGAALMTKDAGEISIAEA